MVDIAGSVQLLLAQLIPLHLVHPTRRDVHEALRQARAPEHRLLGDLAHHTHPADHAAEHDVQAVEEARRHQRDEELGAVGVDAVVGHAHPAGRAVAQQEVLVDEFVAVDGLGAGSVAQQDVARLDYKVPDDSVEWRAHEAHFSLK